jgi:hypothetical protein
VKYFNPTFARSPIKRRVRCLIIFNLIIPRMEFKEFLEYF